MLDILNSSLLFTFSWNVPSVSREVLGYAVGFVNRRGKGPARRLCAGCIMRGRPLFRWDS